MSCTSYFAYYTKPTIPCPWPGTRNGNERPLVPTSTSFTIASGRSWHLSHRSAVCFVHESRSIYYVPQTWLETCLSTLSTIVHSTVPSVARSHIALNRPGPYASKHRHVWSVVAPMALTHLLRVSQTTADSSLGESTLVELMREVPSWQVHGMKACTSRVYARTRPR